MGHHSERLVILFVPRLKTLIRPLTWEFVNQVWKRRKNLLYIGSVHGGELPEMYGITGDHLGTDAIGMRPLSY